MTKAAKAYRNATILSFTLYGAVLFVVNSYLSKTGTDGMLPVVLAVLPILPVVYFARAILVFSQSWDELQRRIAFEAGVVALIVVGLGTFTYGFLEGVGFPRLDTIWIMPLLIASQGVAQLIVARRY